MSDYIKTDDITPTEKIRIGMLLIKEGCNSIDYCGLCPLFDGGTCSIGYIPQDWAIKDADT